MKKIFSAACAFASVDAVKLQTQVEVQELIAPAELIAVLDNLAGNLGFAPEHMTFAYTNPGEDWIPETEALAEREVEFSAMRNLEAVPESMDQLRTTLATFWNALC